MLKLNWASAWKNLTTATLNLVFNGGVLLLEFILALVVGIVVIKLTMRFVRKLLEKSKLSVLAKKFISNTVRFVLVLVLVIVLLQIIKVPITSFITILSAVGLAISLAIQDLLTNFFNGAIILSGKYFKQGDFVEINGTSGYVTEMRMLNTTIITSDNKCVIVPNSKILNGNVINYSANATRRVDFEFEVALDADVQKAKQIILKAIASSSLADTSEKQAFVATKSVSRNGVVLYANFWCKTEDYWEAYYFITDKVFSEFKREKISVSENQITVFSKKHPKLFIDKKPLTYTKANASSKENTKKTKAEKAIKAESKAKVDESNSPAEVESAPKAEAKKKAKSAKTGKNNEPAIESNEVASENSNATTPSEESKPKKTKSNTNKLSANNEQPAKKRGRPAKSKTETGDEKSAIAPAKSTENALKNQNETITQPAKKRGRPAKNH